MRGGASAVGAACEEGCGVAALEVRPGSDRPGKLMVVFGNESDQQQVGRKLEKGFGDCDSEHSLCQHTIVPLSRGMWNIITDLYYL